MREPGNKDDMAGIIRGNDDMDQDGNPPDNPEGKETAAKEEDATYSEEDAPDNPGEDVSEWDEEEDGFEPPVKKKRIGLRILITVFFLGIALAIGLFGGRILQSMGGGGNWEDDLAPVSDSEAEDTIFTVERGWTLSRTAQILYECGLIRSADSFVRLGKVENKAESLKAGRFLLSPSMSSGEILDILVKGSVLTVQFTIPEGYTLRQIAKVFAAKGIADEEEYWGCVKNADFDYPFLEGLPAEENRLEGYLFPDTYVIELDEPLKSVLNRMLKRFQEIWDSLPDNETDLSDREIVILASIVQNEIRLDEERPTAAGVFINRLNTHMLLQSNSTVQYYFDEPRYPMLTADTEIDFPYNTYIYPGLPPGPVGCPGKASLKAALAPEDTGYLYFVAREDGSGGHYFSKTLSEHNKAVAQSRANRSKQ